MTELQGSLAEREKTLEELRSHPALKGAVAFMVGPSLQYKACFSKPSRRHASVCNVDGHALISWLVESEKLGAQG